MSCPDCAAPAVTFHVPANLREYASSEQMAICTACLRTHPIEVTSATTSTSASTSSSTPTSSDPDLSRVSDAFPDGEAGIALALALGKLESLALNRSSIVELVEYAEREGVDVFLTLDRLEAPNAAFDLDRRREQLRDIV